MQKALIILGILILSGAIAVGIIHHHHPIILKYWDGTAGSLGRPIPVKVYTDGRLNNSIRVYKDPKYKHDYLLALKEFDTTGMLQYINIDLDYKWVGRPVGEDKGSYDIVNGELFQDEVGAHFVDFKDDQKGFNFDPNLRFNDTTIKFNVPPHWLKFDSIMIGLNHK